MLNVTYVHVNAVPPPKVVAPPPGDAVYQLIFGKIIKIAATRGQILRLKSTKFYCLRPPDPDGELFTVLSLCPRRTS